MKAFLEDAREALGVSEHAVAKASENPKFSPEVRARLKESTRNALANIAIIEERAGDKVRAILGRATSAMAMKNAESPWTRLRIVYALADELNGFNDGNVACRKGCSHCCHIPVALPEVEAQMLGRAINRKPKNVATVRSPGHYSARQYGYHTPCPFLKNNECSIYNDRPLACRNLINADIDDLLCRLTEPPGPPVPYLDRVALDLAGTVICARKDLTVKTADIREYFPLDK